MSRDAVEAALLWIWVGRVRVLLLAREDGALRVVARAKTARELRLRVTDGDDVEAAVAESIRFNLVAVILHLPGEPSSHYVAKVRDGRSTSPANVDALSKPER